MPTIHATAVTTTPPPILTAAPDTSTALGVALAPFPVQPRPKHPAALPVEFAAAPVDPVGSGCTTTVVWRVSVFAVAVLPKIFTLEVIDVGTSCAPPFPLLLPLLPAPEPEPEGWVGEAAAEVEESTGTAGEAGEVEAETGHTVVATATTSVVTLPRCAGHEADGTEGGHDVTV